MPSQGIRRPGVSTSRVSTSEQAYPQGGSNRIAAAFASLSVSTRGRTSQEAALATTPPSQKRADLSVSASGDGPSQALAIKRPQAPNTTRSSPSFEFIPVRSVRTSSANHNAVHDHVTSSIGGVSNKGLLSGHQAAVRSFSPGADGNGSQSNESRPGFERLVAASERSNRRTHTSGPKSSRAYFGASHISTSGRNSPKDMMADRRITFSPAAEVVHPTDRHASYPSGGFTLERNGDKVVGGQCISEGHRDSGLTGLHDAPKTSGCSISFAQHTPTRHGSGVSCGPHTPEISGHDIAFVLPPAEKDSGLLASQPGRCTKDIAGPSKPPLREAPGHRRLRVAPPPIIPAWGKSPAVSARPLPPQPAGPMIFDDNVDLHDPWEMHPTHRPSPRRSPQEDPLRVSQPTKAATTATNAHNDLAKFCMQYVMFGECDVGDSCPFVHGDQCQLCLMFLLHPSDTVQREVHETQCANTLDLLHRKQITAEVSLVEHVEPCFRCPCCVQALVARCNRCCQC
jgi:hypothetical protein